MHQGSKIKITVNSVPFDRDIPVRTSLGINGMEIGLGWLNSTRKQIRVVRWRTHGICKYVRIGSERGKVLPVIRHFQKLRRVTEKERQKIERWITNRRELGI